MQYRKIRIIFLLIVFIIIYLLAYFLINSGRKVPHTPSRKTVLAMVDNYDITLEDFLHEKEKVLPFVDSPEQVNKDYILDLLIDNLVMLIEGERLELTQKESFLKKIEYFWRQSLIRELISQKNSDVQNQIKISETEIAKFHNSLNKEYYFRYIELTYAKPDFDTIEDHDKYLKENPEKIRYDSGFQWVNIRSINSEFRNYLLNEEVPLKKWLFHQHEDDSYFIIFEKIRPARHVDPYEEMKFDIEEFLREEKEHELIETWIYNLKRTAKITINKDLYSKL